VKGISLVALFRGKKEKKWCILSLKSLFHSIFLLSISKSIKLNEFIYKYSSSRKVFQ
jgi:hypothetical protein